MIVGIGVDIVDIERFARQLTRAARLAERLFVEEERTASVRSLAGRFAAKEAFIKAIGGDLIRGNGRGMRWRDIEIVKNTNGKPEFFLHPPAQKTATERGISVFHLSITHDANIACAFVVAEQ